MLMTNLGADTSLQIAYGMRYEPGIESARRHQYQPAVPEYWRSQNLCIRYTRAEYCINNKDSKGYESFKYVSWPGEEEFALQTSP